VDVRLGHVGEGNDSGVVGGTVPSR
jgi:hypothetical protein